MTNYLNLSNISKTYNSGAAEVRAVEDVSLNVAAGQLVAVRGPSGCGKSTLLLITGGLLSPDAGTVELDGTNPYELSANARAQFRAENIGFVFQQFHLIPYLSVLDNILAPSLAATTESARSRAEELMEHFGLSGRSHHVPGQLSIGERQRTALARAMLNKPKIVLADEPTGNLDSENAEVVLTHLKEFTKTGGAVLLVTHDDRALEYADQTVNLQDGRVLESVQ